MDSKLMDLISPSELLDLRGLADFRLSFARDVLVNDSNLQFSAGSFYSALELLNKDNSCMLTNLFSKWLTLSLATHLNILSLYTHGWRG